MPERASLQPWGAGCDRTPVDAIGQRHLPRLVRRQGGRDFYIRQLRDVKLKPKVEVFNSTDMIQFGEWCGWTLARGHARSGQPAMIGGYLVRQSYCRFLDRQCRPNRAGLRSL